VTNIAGCSYGLCWEVADGEFEMSELSADLLFALASTPDHSSHGAVWPDWLEAVYDVIENYRL